MALLIVNMPASPEVASIYGPEHADCLRPMMPIVNMTPLACRFGRL